MVSGWPTGAWLGIGMPPGSIAPAAFESAAARAAEPVTLAPVDRRFLRALFIDLAGRTPLPDEWKAAQGRTRDEVVHGLCGSAPFYEGFYEEELFYFLLLDNFRPSTDAFVALPKRLAARELSVREALRELVSSQFFNARNPGNDTFVTVVLEQLLGVTVQKEKDTLEAGKKMYDGYAASFLGKPGKSQADLVRIAVESDGFEPFLLARRFALVFGEPPPKKRLASDAAKLRADPLCYPDLVAAWTSSLAYEELLAKPREKSDRVFVRALFADLLGRAPSYQEFRRCRNALLALSDSRPLRSVLIKLMLDSGMGALHEATGQDLDQVVTELFLRFLAREPTPAERATFVGELKSGGATPKTVLRALLTHHEYQLY